jgi:glycosyltransferase involved in cell wall biosynthesis
MLEDNRPVVSVCMITYNHEKYISNAIEGVLMQKCNFKIELIIGEDCSTDETRAICTKYVNQNQSIIKLLTSEENLGMMPNFLRTLSFCQGKYIALCEGDDYWTDPFKLQKQVDLLESEPLASACFHDCAIQNEISGVLQKNACKANLYRRATFKTDDLIMDNFINTCTFLFRRKCLEIPKEFDGFLIDRLLFQLISLSGPICYLRDEMAIYRKHAGGISRNRYTYNDVERVKLRWDMFNQYTGYKYNKSIDRTKKMLLLEYKLNQEKFKRTQLALKNLRLMYYKNQYNAFRTFDNILRIIYSDIKNVFLN